MKPDQLRFLKAKLASARNKHSTRIYDYRLTDPADVKRARAVISAHERKRRSAQDKRRVSMSREHSDCEMLLLFGDPQKALKAVEKFEKSKF